MSVHWTQSGSKAEKADLQTRGNTHPFPHPSKTPRGQRRTEKKK